MTIGIVDTSVFCNVLGVPGRNQDRDHATQTLAKYLESDFTLLLPLATGYETGSILRIKQWPEPRCMQWVINLTDDQTSDR